MRRGTTPTYKRTYPKDLTGGVVNFCFWQALNQIVEPATITPTDYGCDVEVTLSQEQTLSFELGTVYWQIRGLTEDGEAIASETYSEVVTDIHPDGEIEAPVTLGGFYTPDPEEEQEETPEEPEEEVPEENEEEPEEPEEPEPGEEEEP